MDDGRYEVIYRCSLCLTKQVECVIRVANLMKTLEENLTLALRDYDTDETKRPLPYHVCYSKDGVPTQIGKFEFAGLRKEMPK